MKSRYYILFLCLLCCLFSCSRDREIAYRLDSAEALMTEYPDKALSVLETIDASRLHAESIRAKYALLYTQALDKNYIDVASDSLICSAVTYYDRKGSKRERALAHYYYGCVCANMHDSELAMKAFLEAERHAESEPYLCGLIDSRIGQLYLAQYKLSEALTRFCRSEFDFHKAGIRRNEAMVLESQGHIHFLLSNYASAKTKWKEAQAIYAEVGDIEGVRDIDFRLIPVRLDEGEDPVSVKASLRRMCMTRYGEIFHPTAVGLWLDVYQKAGQLDSARICALNCLENRTLSTEHQIAGCYARLVQIEKAAHRFEQALEYGYTYVHLSDSLNAAADRARMEEIEHRYGNEILKASVSNLQLKNRLQQMFFLLVCICIATIMAAAAVLIVRWRKVTREKMKNARAELGNLRCVYEEMAGQYADMKHNLDACNERELKIGKAIEERLTGLHRLVEQASEVKPTAFVKEFKKYTAVNTTSRYALFDLQYVVNRKYCGIIDHLKSQYPQLSKHDLDLCALMCFGFSHAGICYLYNYSDIGSFYNKRSRLRRKLRLPQDARIEEFIRTEIERLQS